MADRTQRAWYWHFVDAAAQIPLRGWLWLIGVVLAIPTSYYGFVWVQAKLVKQQANCYTDLYTNIGSATPATHEAQIQEVLNQLAQYNACNQAVDPKIGTIEFVKKEYERGKVNGP
ncbi:hypothetical protein [Stenotrophomonas sp. Marseille-Q4652]|uniref:hypothetical protein n=1 Tax=Stenotrophomonas sp. Marseille-Q4652 TaxID=2866595 RepID=UPI001CE477D1|nr:hypothetical protein [Stenotrophomonas sp. Marseille-Q4652]